MAKVLLVEDSEDDIELTLRAFRRHDPDQEVTVVTDGEQAVDYLLGRGRFAGRANGPIADLVLLDLNLPKLDGVEVLRRLRENEDTRLLPVVVLTTSAADRDLERCYEWGANSYIRKPVDYRDFEDLVGKLSNYWLELNMRPT